MEQTPEEKYAELDREAEIIAAKRAAIADEVRIWAEIEDLLPDELIGVYKDKSDEVKEISEQLAELKVVHKLSVARLKVVVEELGAILNGEQLRIYLHRDISNAPKATGGVGKGKQGQFILALLEGGSMERVDMVEQIKAEFNNADGHGAFDTLRKRGAIEINEGIVSLP